MKLQDLTIVLPHFCNGEMFQEQQRVWADYPAEMRSRVHVIVVDDCSPKGHRLEAKHFTATGLASFTGYKLLKKIKWNWLACRNLGAKLCETDWMMLTDMDHILPPSTLKTVLSADFSKDSVYRFKRVTAPSKWPFDVERAPAFKPHNDSWLLTKAMFDHKNVGGYDERLSGCYGTSSEFTDRLLKVAKSNIVLNDVIIRYPKEVIQDASIPTLIRPFNLPIEVPWPPPGIPAYPRKNDEKNDEDLRKRKMKRNEEKGWKPLRGLIPWERIA